ncbi:MAG: hypothetical protein JNM30_12980 [Rhodospirillales bacterium]|nr:hypothetical protein [Rhodospirillales bacterium]
MSSITLNKGLSETRDWSEESDESGRWSRRKSLLFMAAASVTFWSAITLALVS